jgi:acetyl esterase/lipase
MNPLFEKYRGEPWLIHTEEDPYAEISAKVWEEIAVMRVKYPMVPGSELVYLDDSTPEGVSREDYKAGNNNLFVYKDKSKHAGEKRVIFYVHGGGFVRGNGKSCRVNAMTQLKKIGLPVAACEYRTAPDFKEPCALDDTEESWNFLTGKLGYSPANVIITGDSAGGNLGISLCHRLKAKGRALPGLCAWISPSLDMTLSLDTHRSNIGKDLYFPKGVAAAIPVYAPDAGRYKNPELSPYWGDFAGLPPAYFCVDDTEVFCDDSIETAAKMNVAGIRVQCHVFHGLWHVFPLTTPATPTGALVFQDIKDFIG